MKKLVIGNSVPINSRLSERRVRVKIPKGTTIYRIAFIPRIKSIEMPTSSIYYGNGDGTATINEAFIEALTQSEEKTKSKVLSVNAGASEKFFYARPKSWGLASFRIETTEGSFDNGFLAPTEVTVVDNTTDASVVYYVYETVLKNLSGTIYVS